MFAIQDNVPLPKLRAYRSRYPFSEMRVGQSFFIPGVRVQRVSHAAVYWAKRLGDGYRFVSRTVTEDGQEGVRCWRVE